MEKASTTTELGHMTLNTIPIHRPQSTLNDGIRILSHDDPRDFLRNHLLKSESGPSARLARNNIIIQTNLGSHVLESIPNLQSRRIENTGAEQVGQNRQTKLTHEQPQRKWPTQHAAWLTHRAVASSGL